MCEISDFPIFFFNSAISKSFFVFFLASERNVFLSKPPSLPALSTPPRTPQKWLKQKLLSHDGL